MAPKAVSLTLLSCRIFALLFSISPSQAASCFSVVVGVYRRHLWKAQWQLRALIKNALKADPQGKLQLAGDQSDITADTKSGIWEPGFHKGLCVCILGREASISTVGAAIWCFACLWRAQCRCFGSDSQLCVTLSSEGHFSCTFLLGYMALLWMGPALATAAESQAWVSNLSPRNVLLSK